MSSAGPWSVKGIDPKAREVAKDLARRSGMTLGEWLNQMIIEGGEPEPPPLARDVREPEPRRRPTLQAGAQIRPSASDDELTRLAETLEAFSDRLEAAEHRSTLAISGIDQSVMGVLSRLDGLERDQNAVGARFEGSLQEVRATQEKLAERLRRMEKEDGPRVEAMKALEAALGRVAAQIYEGESRARGAVGEVRQDLSGLARRVDRLDAEVAARPAEGEMAESVVSRIAERMELAEGRTAAAMRALETSLAGLDERLKNAETRLQPEVEADTPERRFERLATELSARVEASRTELAEHMRAAADGKLDRLEHALRDLSGHVETAERKSAQAIDRMGREVVRIAETLGRRVSTVEGRSAKAVEQMGGEMARIADAMENRMRTAEQVQAEALEKLGSEIGRIAERLAERIAASERRAAAAIDDVGDQVARVTDKLNQRQDRSANELSERIRQSEERTARLLEEARETLDRRMLETQRRSAIEAAVQAAEAPTEPVADFDEAFGAAGYAPQGFADTDPSNPFPDDPFASPPAAKPAFDEPAFDEPAEPSAFEDPAFEAEPELEPEEPEEAEAAAPETPPADEPEALEAPQPAPRSSTRELIEAARAAARQAAASDNRGRRGRPEGLFQAPAPAADPEPRGFGAFLPKKKKRKKEDGTTLRTVLLASGVAAGLTMSAAALQMMYAGQAARDGDAVDAAPAQVVADARGAGTSDAELLAAALAEPAPQAEAAETATPEATAAKPPAAEAAAEAPRPRVAEKPAPAKAAETDPKQLFSAAVREIETGDATGVDPLRRAANLGYAPAQFYLAKLYEAGSAGLKKDAVEARRWTERAALSGDPKAMHNLALYYFEGTGGSKNATQAAAWFRKAAEAGLKDSQYNLARLYEQGFGVSPNAAEAYKWYLIAAVGGDAEAKSSAERMRDQLSPDAQVAAQRSAAAFRPQLTALAQR